MHSVVLLNKLHGCATVFGDLVNVCTFEQSELNAAMGQGVKDSPRAFMVRFTIQSFKQLVEFFLMISREQ